MRESMFTVSQSGFTLIELLVTLVLLGLVTSLLGPSVNSWLTSRQAAATRDAIANQIAGLPLKASINNETIIITHLDQLGLADTEAEIIEPITVLSNGFCKGGTFKLSQGQRLYRFAIKQPF